MNFIEVRRHIKLSGGLSVYFWQPLFSVYKENNAQTYEINTKDSPDRISISSVFYLSELSAQHKCCSLDVGVGEFGVLSVIPINSCWLCLLLFVNWRIAFLTNIKARDHLEHE